MALCLCHLDRHFGGFIVSPDITPLSDVLLVPHSYHTRGKSAVVCIVNASNEAMALPMGSVIRSAQEAESQALVPGTAQRVCCFRTEGVTMVPEHL